MKKSCGLWAGSLSGLPTSTPAKVAIPAWPGPCACVSRAALPPTLTARYTVEGSEHRTYRVDTLAHARRARRPAASTATISSPCACTSNGNAGCGPWPPSALGTLRPGTLPLPPVTVDERLALGTMHDSTALQTHHTPQEDRMPEDEYIPEPDEQDAPVAVLEPLPPAATHHPRRAGTPALPRCAHAGAVDDGLECAAPGGETLSPARTHGWHRLLPPDHSWPGHQAHPVEGRRGKVPGAFSSSRPPLPPISGPGKCSASPPITCSISARS